MGKAFKRSIKKKLKKFEKASMKDTVRFSSLNGEVSDVSRRVRRSL